MESNFDYAIFVLTDLWEKWGRILYVTHYYFDCQR